MMMADCYARSPTTAIKSGEPSPVVTDGLNVPSPNRRENGIFNVLCVDVSVIRSTESLFNAIQQAGRRDILALVAERSSLDMACTSVW